MGRAGIEEQIERIELLIEDGERKLAAQQATLEAIQADGDPLIIEVTRNICATLRALQRQRAAELSRLVKDLGDAVRDEKARSNDDEGLAKLKA